MMCSMSFCSCERYQYNNKGMAAICNCGHSYEVHKNAEKGVLKK
jgi:hypothetical protein